MGDRCVGAVERALVPWLWLWLWLWGASGTANAQGGAVLGVSHGSEIQITGEPGATYVIESAGDLKASFWVTRGWISLETTTGTWVDPVPRDAPRRFFRASKVIKPEIQTVPDMLWIPPGAFVMGSPDTERGRWAHEGPQTAVRLTKGFWLGRCEVTQREYLAVMGTNPSMIQPPVYPWNLDCPVEQVTWTNAVAFCERLTEQERAVGHLPEGYAYQLPTEAQWEYACRAGTTTRYSFGDALECDDGCGFCALMDAHMWWCGNAWSSGYRTQPVGQKSPNPWGLFDMHGNVSEWCRDWISTKYSGGLVHDPTGPTSGPARVMRGGRWYSWVTYAIDARYCRSAHRGYYRPDGIRSLIGFRLVLAPGAP